MIYYFCFRHADGWISNFVKRGCGHVYVGCASHEDARINFVDGLYYGLACSSIPELKGNMPKMYEGYPIRVLKVVIDDRLKYPKAYKHFNALLMFNRCVTIAKYVSGLRFWSLTPWQLYKKLRKIEQSPSKGLKYGIISIEEVL